MSRARERAGRSREMFLRPVVPSGKAKVRSRTWTDGEGGVAAIPVLAQVVGVLQEMGRECSCILAHITILLCEYILWSDSGDPFKHSIRQLECSEFGNRRTITCKLHLHLKTTTFLKE